MGSGDAAGTRQMRLRYEGACVSCRAALPAGTLAVYDRGSKTVTCLTCVAGGSSLPSANDQMLSTSLGELDDPAARPEQVVAEIFAGVAGSSARREHDRRSNKRETRIRETHPVLGGLILALSDDPQSTKAWAVGAQGEERLGRRLDGLVGERIRVLHDRRIPRSRANIDHIVVCPTGVFVIDAKKYTGRPSLGVEGGLFRPRVEKLIVGSRDCTRLVEGVHKQVDLVSSALISAGMGQIPVRGMLCFVDADWPIIGGAFRIDGLDVLWPKKAVEQVLKPGIMDDLAVSQVFHALATAFPPA
jgi:hypothetical protein